MQDAMNQQLKDKLTSEIIESKIEPAVSNTKTVIDALIALELILIC